MPVRMHDLRCLFIYDDIFIIILKAYRSAFSGEFTALHRSWFIMHDVRSEQARGLIK